MSGRKWSELSRRERSLVMGAGAVQVTLLAAALVDIQRRPAEQINGPKRLWRVLAFINYAGPICYFLFGRKR
ncbi:PLD nuclease N-terminal domain-containing protein [Actinomadura formosensis]|uniref:PLD nuclease N-terminal domain-containing protein n=1 Tax=Actinomadura formosensis TaxID=60706 RepID=UPI000A6FFC7D|nr:PLD nuclease N-terminal domain-containing protein [Actinomadura formosensis]